MSNLCCLVHPCYKCGSCGFQECLDHWNERLQRLQDKEDVCHFSSLYVCRVTKETVGFEQTGDCAYYKVIK